MRLFQLMTPMAWATASKVLSWLECLCYGFATVQLRLLLGMLMIFRLLALALL